MNTFSRRNIIRFLVATGVVSGLLFGLVMLLNAAKAPGFVLTIAENLSAWSPTLAVLILFRVLYPGQKLGEFLKGIFSVRIKPLTAIIILGVQAGVFALAIAAYAIRSGIGFSALIVTSLPALLLAFVVQLTSGSTGEELGWRGFLLIELQKKYSLLKAALIVGLIWGLWHFPIWLTLGYTGIDLIRYIVFFMLQIISLSVVMAVYYNRHKNLLLPIWIHFLTNFLAAFVTVKFLFLIGWMALGYGIWAMVMVVVNKKDVFKLHEDVE